MKFSKVSQLFLVSAIGLLVATFLSACQIVTIDYVFVASSAALDTTGLSCPGGSIGVFAADSQSGALRKGGDTVCSGGQTPVAMITSPDYTNLYVAHSGDNTVVHLAVAINGSLTAKETVTLSTPPTALAVSPDGSTLFVVSGTSTATLTSYALSSGTIGAVEAQQTLTIPGYAGDTVVPTGVAVLPSGKAVYATLYDKSAYNPGGTASSLANPGWIFGFSTDSNGTLAVVSGSPWKAGVRPSAVAIEPRSAFVYVTDFASNELIGYGVYSGYALSYLVNGPFKTGNEPSALAIDPRAKFLYVANELDSTVSAFVLDSKTGTPSSAVNATGNANNNTDTEPVTIAVDPALGRFVYTGNYIGNTMSGFRLDPTAGTLTTTQSTPYPTSSKPTAIVIVPHGNHAVQTITP